MTAHALATAPPTRWHALRVRAPAGLLAALLCLVFVTGGSSWGHEAQLLVLRPAALVVAALGVLTLQRADITRFALVWALFGSAALLTAAHLVPLPFEWWSQLPGRDLIAAIDRAAQIGPIARPLSLSPGSTLNALFALAVPFAVLVLAVQLDSLQHQMILALTLTLLAASAAVGLVQASGGTFEPYSRATATAGLFVNRNHQGAALALLVPMAAALVRVGFDGKIALRLRGFVALGLAVVTIPLLIVTGSRSALVVLALALVFAGLIVVPQNAGAGAAWKRRAGAAVALARTVLGLVWLTVLAARDVALDRLDAAGDDLRWPVWQSVAEMVPAYLPWGTGIGSYAEAYQILEPDALLRPSYSNHAHNELLEIALTAGVPGLALAAFAGVALVGALWRAYARSASDAPAVLARLGTALIVLLAAASVTDYPLRTPILASVLALAAVWAAGSSAAAPSRSLTQGMS